jgi:hypothetical protein
MTDRLSAEQFNSLPNATKEYLRSQGLAPDAGAPFTAQGAATPAPATRTALPPGVPDLDGIPDQSNRGPEFVPFDREYDFEATLDQVQHRFSERSGPNFYATITITKASPSAEAAGLLVGTHRAWGWYYNPSAFGKEKDKSDASLRRFKDFVRQVSGLPEGSAGVNAKSAELLEKSRAVPSLGIRLRAIAVRGSEKRDKPGTYFYNQTIIPLG